MMYIMPPMPPKPERFMFESSEKYLAAMNSYQSDKRKRDDMMKTNLAFHIVVGFVICAIGFAMACLPLYMSFGLNGPIGLVVAGALFWAAVSRVKMWL